MVVPTPTHRTRSLPVLLVLGFAPPVAAGIAGATAAGGSAAIDGLGDHPRSGTC